MMGWPSISIIVPVYDVADYIEGCLQSVMAQAYEGEVECILVDDSSQDDGIAIARHAIDAYGGPIRFRLLAHDCNRGASAARNTGTRAATGRYIFYLDSDDRLTSQSLATLARPLLERDYDFVFADHSFVCDWGLTLPFSLSEGPLDSNADIIRTYRWGWYVMPWNKLLRRDFLEQNDIHFVEGIMHEDELWSFHITCVAQSAYAIPQQTYLYLLREGSVMSPERKRARYASLNEVIRGEAALLRQYGQECNIVLYNLIEEHKRWQMKDAVRLFDAKGAYDAYRQLRSLPAPSLFRARPMCRQWLKSAVRDVHRCLPVRLGYIYIRLLNCLSCPPAR